MKVTLFLHVKGFLFSMYYAHYAHTVTRNKEVCVKKSSWWTETILFKLVEKVPEVKKSLVNYLEQRSKVIGHMQSCVNQIRG